MGSQRVRTQLSDFHLAPDNPFFWVSLIAQSVKTACNAGDPSSIPGSGRSAREGIGYPLQYSWASLVAQLVKNSLAMQETWVRSLSWEDPLEKGKDTHSSTLAWRISWTLVHGVAESQTQLSDFHITSLDSGHHAGRHGS